MDERIVIAGFGGQGVMLAGQLLTYAGMYEELEVSWLPSYGPEMRGGTANCHVCVSDKPIGSPVIAHATSIIIMNNPSLEKFIPMVVPGGDVYLNTSLVEDSVERDDVNVYSIKANDLATQLGTVKAANMVMLGAYLKHHPIVKIETIEKVLTKSMTGKKAQFIPINMQAMKQGMAQV